MKRWMNKFNRQGNEDQASDAIDAKISFLTRMNEALVNLAGKYKQFVSLIVTAIALMLLAIIFIQNHRQTNTVADLSRSESNQTQVILNQLGDINAQLEQMTENPAHSSQFKTAVMNISNDISVIKQSALMEKNNFQQMTTQLAAMREDVDTQLQDLRGTLANNRGKHFVDPNALPFRVIAIDIISQQPFVSVEYAQQLTPLMVGDSLAGWQVTSANYAKAEVEFKNAQHHYVKITLPG